jgi:hypothetical protein
MESKRDRFKRLAVARGDRLIREIALLGNLSNRKNYDFTHEDVDALFGPLEDELRECRARFDPQSASSRRVRFDDES